MARNASEGCGGNALGHKALLCFGWHRYELYTD
jgi:hypothetical protein